MGVFSTRIEPPVFWDRMILGYYVLCTTPYLLLAFHNWLAFAVACGLLGVAGKLLEILVNLKGFETGAIGTVVKCNFAMGSVIFILGGFFWLLAWYESVKDS